MQLMGTDSKCCVTCPFFLFFERLVLLVTKSILDIIASTPPEAFSQLWDDDVFAHFQFRSRFKEGVTV